MVFLSRQTRTYVHAGLLAPPQKREDQASEKDQIHRKMAKKNLITASNSPLQKAKLATEKNNLLSPSRNESKRLHER